MTRKKVKLVLSGSGTRYPCFIGTIQRLLEEGYEIEEVCGTSGGAIIAAGFASWYDPEKPEEIVKVIQHTSVIRIFPVNYIIFFIFSY